MNEGRPQTHLPQCRLHHRHMKLPARFCAKLGPVNAVPILTLGQTLLSRDERTNPDSLKPLSSEAAQVKFIHLDSPQRRRHRCKNRTGTRYCPDMLPPQPCRSNVVPTARMSVQFDDPLALLLSRPPLGPIYACAIPRLQLSTLWCRRGCADHRAWPDMAFKLIYGSCRSPAALT